MTKSKFSLLVRLANKRTCWLIRPTLRCLFLGSGLKGVDDLCYHTGEFSPSPSSPSPYPPPPGPYFCLEAHISASGPKSQSWGPNPNFKSSNSILKPKSHLWGLNFSFEGFEPQDWDLGLKAGIWASRQRYGPGGWGGVSTEKEEKKEKEIIPLCDSLGHWPLQVCCPAPSLNYNHNQLKQGTSTTDQLMLLWLLYLYIEAFHFSSFQW